MLNNCIRIGLDENITSLKSLSLKAYRLLEQYDAMSYYKLCAISKAAGILKNYRKAERRGKPVKQPYAQRPQLTTSYGFKISNGNLLLPIKPRSKIKIPLNPHTLQVLSRTGLAAQSVTLTATTITVSYSKDVPPLEPAGLMAVDRNLDNVTVADSNGSIRRHNLADATEIKAMYREVKSHLTRNDSRIRQRVYAKYGVRQRNHVRQLLHRTSKQIITEAKRSRSAIVIICSNMEKLPHAVTLPSPYFVTYRCLMRTAGKVGFHFTVHGFDSRGVTFSYTVCFSRLL